MAIDIQPFKYYDDENWHFKDDGNEIQEDVAGVEIERGVDPNAVYVPGTSPVCSLCETALLTVKGKIEDLLKIEESKSGGSIDMEK